MYFIYLLFCDYFSIFMSENQGIEYDRTATNNSFKTGVVE